MKKTVLLIIHTNTYFTNLLPIARLLEQSSKYDPTFYFDFLYPTIYRDLSLCKELNISYTCNFTEPPCLDTSDPLPANDASLKQKVRRWLRARPKSFESLVISIYRYVSDSILNNVFYQIYKLKRKELLVKRIIKQYKPVLLIFASDNRYDIPVFIKAAHEENIPAILAPAFMASALEWARFVVNVPLYQVRGPFSYFISKIYKKWVLTFDGKTLLALPVGHVMAWELLGIAPPLPWILHSGKADAIALESVAVRDYCISERLAPEKLVVTGSVIHDSMAQILKDETAQRQELYQSLDLPVDKPMLLSALPPDSFYIKGSGLNADFRDYRDLVEFWIRSLAKAKNYNVVICLHPSVKYEDLKYIEDWGVKISRQSTAELIPLCHIYVACVSATIQWAIACQKPVINYDVYRYRYTDYLEVDGVINIEEKSEYLHYLNNITQDPDFYRLMAAKQNACSKKWGLLDGQAGNRILQLLEETEKYPIGSRQ